MLAIGPCILADSPVTGSFLSSLGTDSASWICHAWLSRTVGDDVLPFDGSHFRLCETPGEQGECWANIIVVTIADEVLVTKLAESHSEVIIMHINVEEVEDKWNLEGDQQN